MRRAPPLLRLLPGLVGLLVLGCDDGPAAGPPDAQRPDAALDLGPDAAPAGPDAYVLPPRPAQQTCGPAPVDFDRLPDLALLPGWLSAVVVDPVAVHQPTVDAAWWVAEASGRLLRITLDGTDTRAADYGRLTDGPPLLAVAFAGDLTDHGTLYSLQAQGAELVITAHHIARGTQWVQRVDDQVLLRRAFTGEPRGGLVVDGAAVVAALPPAPDGPAGLWRVDVDPPQALPGVWTDPTGCAADPQGGLWCLDHQPEGDALVRVADGAATLQVLWPGEPECRRQLGPLYRGAEHPLMWGGLITYDPCAQAVFLSKHTADGRQLDAPVLDLPGPVVFGTGWAGRTLALTAAGLGRLQEADPDHALGWPERLSATGCFAEVAALTPGPDLIPYAIRSPLWTDGAAKRRFLVLPPGEALGLDDGGRLAFPVGSVILKDFAFMGPNGLRSVETRTMTRYPFGWGFHTWRWDDDGGDATRLDGAEAEWREIEAPDASGAPAALRYLYPSRGNCLACHDPQGPTVLGPTLAQLAQPDGGGVLPALRGAGLLPEGATPAPLPDPADASLPAEARARAYLHGNCAHCHRPGGWTPPDLGMDLRFDTPLADMGVCDVPRLYASFGVPGDVRIAAGDPDASYVLQRMLHRGYGQMPPVATERVDPVVEPLFRAWIEGLVCP